MALPAGWVQVPDGKSYTNQTFKVNNVEYELVVNSQTGNADLYQKNITGNKQIASTDSGNNWKLTNVDKFLQTLPQGTTDKNKANEYFANNFTLKLNQNRANLINGVSTNISSFTNTPGVNNVAQAATGTKPISQPATPSTGGPLSALTNTANAVLQVLNDPLSGAEELAKGFEGNEKELFKNFLLKYPNDLLETRQDTLSITQFTYKAPQESIFQTGNLDKIVQEGLVRGTDYKGEAFGTVILPMPNGVRDSNSVDWQSDSMNALNAAVASQVASNVAGYGGALVGGQLLSAAGLPVGNTAVAGAVIVDLLKNFSSSQNLKTSLGTGLVSTIATAAGYEISPESILSRGFGIVPNSNIELLFNGPMLRDFGFAYRMSPRNETEAKAVRNIIRFFKQGMAARKNTAGNNFFLSTPHIFKLKYTYNGKDEIKGVNKIKTCALTTFNVDYSPDGQWAAYEEGQPASVMISMSFKELEPIYSTDYNNVSNDSVGF